MNLYQKYTENRITASDINQHLHKLYEYGKKVSHITEFGVRTGQSTSAFLATQPKRLHSYDISRNEAIGELIDLARKENVNFEYIIENSNTADILPTDLLFIDSEHTEENTLAELKNTAGKVSKYMIFHDSNYPDNPNEKTVRSGIDIFLKENKNWKIIEEYTNSYGLLILENT